MPRSARPWACPRLPCASGYNGSPTAGGYDILAEVVCEDDDHLLEVVNRRVRAIPGVRNTETFVYLKLRKQIYTWGTR